MTGLIIILLLVFGMPYIWRWLRPYAARWARRRAESYLRNAMGMPPRGSRGSSTSGSARTSRSSSAYGGRRARTRRDESGPVIPREYAEDVEYTEIRSYSSDTVIAGDTEVRYKSESQVSDAEIIEIRKDK